MDIEFLKYGDEIVLYTDQAFGYLATFGYNSKELFMQQCSKLHRSHIFNMRNFVFQVVPKLTYESSKQMRREKKTKKMNQIENQGVPQNMEEKQREQEKQKMLEKRIKQQNENNEIWIQKNFGKKVLYGTEIQLCHVDSKMFMQHAKKASQVDRRCQQLELSDNPSSQRVTFIIQQRYKYRQDGEPVVYLDHILLYNQKYNCYLHVSEDYVKEQERLRCSPSIYRPLSPRRRDAPDEVYRKMEANCSRNFFKWQVVSFRQIKKGDASKFICSQDVIRLKHAETSGYLSYDVQSQLKPGEPCYVRMYKGKDAEGAKTTHDLFEIEAHSDFKRETIVNGGNCLEWQMGSSNNYCRVRFRHLNSGRILTVSMVDNKITNEDDDTSQIQKKLVLTVGNNLTAEQVNAKLDQTRIVEKLNENNLQFNSLTDPQTTKITKGVHSNQVWDIENTIIDPISTVKAGSVVKIMNRFFNPITKAFDNLAISTEFKKIDSDEQNLGDEETDLSKFQAPTQIEEKYQGQLDHLEGKNSDELLEDMMEIRSFDGSIFCVPPLDKIDSEHTPDKAIFTATTYDESDTVVLNFTRLIKDGSMEDVFILEKVDKEELNAVLFIHSCVPKIKEFMYNLRQRPQVLTSPYLKEFEELITGLIFFVCITDNTNPFTCEGLPNVQGQRFLRELKLIDLLVDVLIYPFEGDDPVYLIGELTQKSPMTRICQLIYRLFKHCVQDNEFNKFYVAQWISHFFNQSMITSDQNNLMVSDTISEIVKNNKLLLDKQINETVIRNIVENCAASKKSSRFLNLIATLSICNGEAIGSNQDDTCVLFLEDDSFSQLLIKVESGYDQEKKQVYYAVIEEPEYIEQNNGEPIKVEIDKLYDYFKENNDLRMYDYFESMINLVSLMCFQRNYKGINICQDKYPLDFSIDCFFNQNVPLILRANLAKIVLAVHLDKDPLEKINLPVLTRVWQELSNAKNTIPSAKRINKTLLKLKDFVLEYFQNINGVLRKNETSQNTLTLEILNILEKMIILGFYQNEEELLNILNPIIFVLDGSTDYISVDDEILSTAHAEKVMNGANLQPLQRDKKKRYQIDEYNNVIFSIKKKIIKILSVIIDFQNDLRLTKLLTEFQKADTQLTVNPALCAKEMFFLQNALAGKFEEGDAELKSQVDEKMINWMKKAYLNKNLDLQRKSERDIICILLDLILYQDAVVVNQAFTLLAKYFQQKRAIINYAQLCQLLQDEQEVTILKKVSFLLRDMNKVAENAEFWLGKDNEESLRKANKFMNELTFMTDLCLYNPDRVIDFEEKKKNDDEEEEQEEEFLNVSELLADWDNEDPKICHDDMVSDIKNQTILRNLRAHEVAFQIISQQGSEGAENQNIYLRVLEKCYIFLIKFVRGNKENQTAVVEELDNYMEEMELGVHAWELIAETFKCADHLQGHNITSVVKKGIKIIDNLPKETLKKTILLSFLSYFMKPSGNTENYNKEYQYLIISECTSSVRSNMVHLFVGEKGLRDLHLYMMEMKSGYFDFIRDDRLVQEIVIPPELCYTIELIKLLGVCGFGKNSKTEQIASDKLTMDDVIVNLRIADFCYPLKQALVFFMESIFFDIEKEVSEDNIERIKEFVNILSNDLEKFVEIEQRLKAKAAQLQGGKKPTAEVQEQVDDVEQVQVDINRNFTMLTAFGSIEIVVIMEDYIFNTVYKALQSYFILRLPIKPTEKDFYKRLFLVLQKAVDFCKKDGHWENAKSLFNSMKQVPQLKEFGGENLSNKQLTQYMMMKDQKKNPRKSDDDDGTNMLVGMPILSQTEKLNGYLFSAGMSDKLLDEFEQEFGDIVIYIINIKQKTNTLFNGTNTLEVKELISALIQVSDIQSNIDPNLRILCLKVIRKVVELEHKNSYQPAIFWEEDWLAFREQVKKKQDMLIDLDVVKLICNLISFENKRTIKEEGLLGSAALLMGGNHDSQMKFYEFILKDQQNSYVLSLKEMLVESFQFIQVSQIRRNDLKMKHIQLNKQIEEYEQLANPSRQQRIELQKIKEQRRIVEDEIKETDYDDNENPAAYTTNDLTLRRALTNAEQILRFMQLLCENHNPFLQNILRQQLNQDLQQKSTSFDLCSYFSKILEQFQMVMNNQTFGVCNQLVDTLVEMIQGPCKLNQENLVKAKIIDSCREYISGFEQKVELKPLGFESEEDIDQIGEFKGSIITMLTSLLEGEVVPEIIDRMSGSLDFYNMKQRLVKIFKRFAEKLLQLEDIVIKDLPLVKIDNRLEKDSFEEHISEAFQIYILMHQLADNNDIAAQALEKSAFSPDQWKAFEFIRSHTGRIEVFVDNGLQRIYFPIKPVCHFISIEKRRQLMNDVNRESQQTKVKELIDEVPALIDEMNHNEELSRASIQITPARLMMLKDFSTLVGIVINLLYLFFAKRKFHYREYDISNMLSDSILYLGLVQGSSSLLLIFFFSINKKNLITKQKWRTFNQENKQLGLKVIENEDRLKVHEMSYEMTHMILMVEGPEAIEFQMGDEPGFGNWFTALEFKILNIFFFIQDATFQYQVLYFGISLLGLLSSTIYYSLHLLDIIQRSPVLQNVMKALSMSSEAVAMTGLLMIVFLYIFLSIYFFYLQDNVYDFTTNSFDHEYIGEQRCETFVICTIWFLNYGIRKGGGIGETSNEINFDNLILYILKFLIDSGFEIVINLIALKIIFGIIVSTFAELRDLKAKNDEDMHNVCYICNYPRMIFDKNCEGGFVRHIEKDHNLWQYVYYIVHLYSLNSSDYNGIETFVAQKLEEGDISWVPRQKAMCLSKILEEDEDENVGNEQQIIELKKYQYRMKKCLNYFEDIENKILKKERIKEEERKQQEAKRKREEQQN